MAAHHRIHTEAFWYGVSPSYAVAPKAVPHLFGHNAGVTNFASASAIFVDYGGHLDILVLA